jgi:hypothetical protein
LTDGVIDRRRPPGVRPVSLAAAEPVPLPEPELPRPMPDGITTPGLMLSAALHLILGTILIFGLPTLFHPPAPEEMPIAVQLVTMGPQTRATHPNPNTPEREAKLEPPLPGPHAEQPPPVPAPPKPAPPPSAAEAPPQPPAPAPPQPKPTPPAPAAAAAEQPQQAQTPPPPQPKPSPPPPPPKPAVAAAPTAPPAPPRETARAEAKAEAKKYNPGQFDALLRNLAAEDAAPSPDAHPQPLRAATGRASSQPRAPLGSQLSASEMDLVREQIARCWNIPAGARDARDLIVEIRVAVAPDGTVERAEIVDQGRAAADPFYRAAAESARRAFFNPLCRPLRLPPDKYEIWKDMTVAFSPKDIL